MFEIKKGERRIYKFPNYPKCVVDLYQEINRDNGKILIAGVGSANCDDGDKYDKNFGIELAGTRAEINMLKEYEKILIKMTKQPEWRKEKKEKQFKEEHWNMPLTAGEVELIQKIRNLYTLINGVKV